VVLVVGGAVDRAAVLELSAHLRVLLEESDADLVVCDVGAVLEPDLATIDALAQLQLAARRLGRSVQLRQASKELQDLLALAGLSDVLPLCARLRLEGLGQTEQREELPIDEVRDAADPTV
jgi:ABC-type transporter Mla MlaB component